MDIESLFSEGLRHHMEGRIDTAENLFREVLRNNPKHVDALHHLGLIHLQSGLVSQAIEKIRLSLVLDPSQPNALANLGHCLNLIGDYLGASESCKAALEIDPSNDGAWANLGNAQRSLKLATEARSSYEKALELCPGNPRYTYNLGLSPFDQGQFKQAKEWFQRCLASDPSIPEAHNNLAACLLKLHDPLIALHHADTAIQLKSDYSEAWTNRGNALNDLKRHEEALASYDRSIGLKPDYADAWSNRGLTLGDLRCHEEALASHERAIQLKPEYAKTWCNRGVALNGLRRHKEALASYERAIKLKPDYAKAWNNRGVALGDLKRHEEALASYDRAIKLKPDYAEAWNNRGVALGDLKRHEEALASYERSIELKPDADYILGDLVHTQMKICDWTDLDERCHTLESRLLKGDRASTPFSVIGLFDDPPLQKRSAELYAKSKLGFKSLLGPITRRSRGDKIRVAYFSMDFREHPVAHLVAELIECHDRNKFEIFGFSFGVNTGDTMRKRLEDAFDKFLEVSNLSELDIARLARDHQIDIAIDLGGYTQDSRPAIFAHRAAPIQINYLGFPGTMGTGHLDYFIGDRVAVSDDNLGHFSEKVIFLPNSFQANPSQRPIGSKESSRATYNLPESGFVFCCFNNVWKITPDVFRIWVRILKEAKGSVLWIQTAGQKPLENLSKEFESAGINASRIIFASKLPSLSDHLSRYRLADLFLDTAPYGAHTTASDALWVGLPVLTRSGQSFASRVAGSLLHAVGLPELITQTAEDYESLAVELANNPDRIAALKARLAKNRPTCTLFNTTLFTKHIESAYQAAYDRYHAGLAPDHIYVSS